MTSYLKTLLDGSAISGNTNLIAWQFEDVATSVPVQGTSPIEVDDWHWCHKITSVGIPRIGFHFNVGSYVATHWLTIAVPVKEKCCQLFLNCLFYKNQSSKRVRYDCHFNHWATIIYYGTWHSKCI